MKLNKSTPRESVRPRDTQKSGFTKFAPLLASLAFTAITLLPSMASAQQEFNCSAKRVERPMEAFQTHKVNRGKVTGLTMYVPAGKGKRLEIGIPDGLVNELASRARSAPESERTSMLRESLKTALADGIAALGTKSSASFKCRPVSAKAAPAPATTSKSEPAKAAGPTISDPLPPRKKSGSGSNADPYVIEIPVPRGTKKGTKIAESTLHVRPIREGKAAERIYFKLSFVAEPNSDKNYRSDAQKLATKVAEVMGSTATTHVRRRDKGAEPISSGGLIGNCLREIRGVANTKSDTVGDYLGISPEPQKRRRTLGGI